MAPTPRLDLKSVLEALNRAKGYTLSGASADSTEDGRSWLNLEFNESTCILAFPLEAVNGMQFLVTKVN